MDDETAERDTTFGITTAKSGSRIIDWSRLVSTLDADENEELAEDAKEDVKGKTDHMVTWPSSGRNYLSNNCSFRSFIPTAPLYMAEKDATIRLRRAIKGLFLVDFSSLSMIPLCAENNLFLVKRLIQRTDMRNPDPGPKRYTSLAWTAVLGHEETFEFLLTAGHDDEELSKVCVLCCHKSCPLEISKLHPSGL